MVAESRRRTPFSMVGASRALPERENPDAFFDAIAYEPHHTFVPWVTTDPALERFRRDPRYAQLMARFKLPAPKPGRAR